MINEQISSDENLPKNERQSASWDLQNAIRNYSTLVATQFAVAFFSFASVWLATHYLGTKGYGIRKYSAKGNIEAEKGKEIRFDRH